MKYSFAIMASLPFWAFKNAIAYGHEASQVLHQIHQVIFHFHQAR